MNFLKNYHKILFWTIIIFLFIVPFFWFKPGEMDLGGDSTRLYFYDPISFLINASLYVVMRDGVGTINPCFYYLPFLIVLIFLKFIFQSPYILIALFNSIKLVVGFLSVYLITKELIKSSDTKEKFKQLFSITAGLFYILSLKMTGNYDKALLSHNQIFLNPLVFYFLMKYLFTENKKFIFYFLFTSFLFAPDFSLIASPTIFSFYPLSLIFLFSYTILIIRKKIIWKNILVILIAFLGLQSFHLIPQIVNIFSPGSIFGERIFDKSSILNIGIQYFLAVLPLSKASENFLLPPLTKQLNFFSFIFPLIILLGFYFNKQKNKAFLLTGIFFIITYFFLTAKLSDLGVALYIRLFYLPGFSMFRNFIGQWSFVFSFFYALLIGQGLLIISQHLKERYIKIIIFTSLLFLVFGSWSFLNGQIVNRVHDESKGIKIGAQIDPSYEKTISYIKKIPEESRFLTLPFSDPAYQLISGKNGGAYVGPSTLPFLTAKGDFAGYFAIPSPLNDIFLDLAKRKNYSGIKRLLSILNVKYIFYNSDPKIYDSYFPAFPYAGVKPFLPKSQKEYSEFVKNLSDRKIFSEKSYQIFKVTNDDFLPRLYIPKNLIFYKQLVNRDGLHSFLEQKSDDKRFAYLNNNVCKDKLFDGICETNFQNDNIPRLYFQKINPTKYKVKVFNAKAPYLLVFLNSFHKNWKVYFSENSPEKGDIIKSYFNQDIEEGKTLDIFLDNNTFETIGMKSLQENHHLLVNGYANGWYITPTDVNKSSYELIVEMNEQKIFYYSFPLSIATFIALIFWVIFKVFQNRYKKD